MVMEGAATVPVSAGMTGAAAAGGSGKTTGSRGGGAAGWCAQAPSDNAMPPRSPCRLSGVMGYPLTELILPGSQLSENLEGFGQNLARVRLGGGAHAGLVAAQKGIDFDFQAQGRGQTGISRSADAIDAFLVIKGRAIGGLDSQGKPKIGGRVLVTTKNSGLGG